MSRTPHMNRSHWRQRLALHPRWLVLALAVLAGLAAAWFAYRHLQSVTQALEAGAQQRMRPVIVAAADLPAGTQLHLDHLAVRQMPEAWLPSDVLAPLDHALVEAAVLQHAVREGDPIQWANLAPPAERFSSRLAAGRRAVTIPVDDMNSLSGMLQPGDQIDLFVSFQHAGERVTAPLLQQMRVLATGHRQEDEGWESGGRYATVTLEATPEESVRLIAARQQGSISALLRHGTDTLATPPELRGDLASLLGLRSAPAPAPAKRSVPVLFGDRHPGNIPALGESAPVGSARGGSESWQVPGLGWGPGGAFESAPIWSLPEGVVMPPWQDRAEFRQ